MHPCAYIRIYNKYNYIPLRPGYIPVHNSAVAGMRSKSGTVELYISSGLAPGTWLFWLVMLVLFIWAATKIPLNQLYRWSCYLAHGGSSHYRNPYPPVFWTFLICLVFTITYWTGTLWYAKTERPFAEFVELLKWSQHFLVSGGDHGALFSRACWVSTMIHSSGVLSIRKNQRHISAGMLRFSLADSSDMGSLDLQNAFQTWNQQYISIHSISGQGQSYFDNKLIF